MGKNNDAIFIGKGKHTVRKKSRYIPSKLQADALFTFTTNLEYLIPIIKNLMISPRYCVENIRYLKIPRIKDIAYPMRCFCDINLHRIEDHLEWYGYYGLALTKEWGIKNGIQPLHYINTDSELCKDFTKVFKNALEVDISKESNASKNMKNFLLHEMMYYKPYIGMFRNRNTNRKHRKCFADECEWRYIPDVTAIGFEQVYYDETIINAGVLNNFSNAMEGLSEISLRFDYSDLKYIIVKDTEDFNQITDIITQLKISDLEKRELISRIIVWEKSKGDF